MVQTGSLGSAARSPLLMGDWVVIGSEATNGDVGVRRLTGVLCPLQCSLGSSDERLVDVDALLRAGPKVLQVGVALAGTPSLDSIGRNSPARLVDLVANRNEREGVSLDRAACDDKFLLPAVKVFECLGVAHIIAQYTSLAATVEGNTQAPEPLLACRVPDLESDKLVVDHHLLCEEVCSNRRSVLVGIPLVDVLVQHRRLADPAVSKDNNLDNSPMCRYANHFCSLAQLRC
eukprot:CAMPEP_0114613656 /NCGR_PEP_ID=MMETSP0168-20121206/5245_1 /TAXON_ID=95228 ORGANISM="Vannella sp., Strain DIVA3 517/6/12" /NCGR_SAMPLE_ID=MMETSP0168 /ASSEMBLY_ACC=CAM_ASM_000044 /LENGTH=231 /DNA_ID=CAMNT_0001824669 /DNA_START=125 /DNA_END=817 /DNA_ORIENTATION=-